jgi:adenylate kinase family enzyme
MKRIMIIGSGGSGKSTFASRLGEITKIPVFHLDAYYWKPGWVPTPKKEWEEIQLELIQKEEWIIDGNYGSTLELRMREADTIISFDLSKWITTYRVVKRRIQYHGKTRPDLNEDCPEQLDWEFIKWVWNFRKTRMPGILEKLVKHKEGKKIIVIRKPSEAEEILDRIKYKEQIESNFKEGENIL